MTESTNIKKLRQPSISVHLRADTHKRYQPREKIYQVFDKNLPTYHLRIFPTGRKTYAIRKRLMGVGQKVYVTIGSVNEYTEKEAREIAIEIIHLINKGINPNEEKERLKVEAKKSKTTYGDFCDKHGIIWAEKDLPKSWLKT